MPQFQLCLGVSPDAAELPHAAKSERVQFLPASRSPHLSSQVDRRVDLSVQLNTHCNASL